TGYVDEPPEDVELMDGMYYNHTFPGHQIAMPQPLYEDGVEYEDGTPASVEQMAKDVTTFLAWTAEPELEERKSLGIKVLLFVILLTAMLYAVKRRVWSKLH
ncbi:MAG: cytochrome c1, partial [Alphaproteobacteria bacterium]